MSKAIHLSLTNSTPYLSTFFICLLLWVLLTTSFAIDELISGVLVSLFVALLCAKNLKILNGMRLSLEFLPALLRYLVFFFIALIKANIDVAQKVLALPIEIRPQLITVKTTMQSDLGKLLLANSITLTPGTLSVDLRDNELLIHWIDVKPGSEQAVSEETVAYFEKLLKGFVW